MRTELTMSGLVTRHTFILMDVLTQRTMFSGGPMRQIKCCKGHFTAKFTAWCAMNSKTIIGPFWFEDDEMTTTVNQENYRSVIRKFCATLRRRRTIVMDRQ